MTHGTEHHLEEAEHVQHAAHDPFDRRVAMTMAIVAAALACITLLSHRAHNATLDYQIQANQNITAAVDQWGYYQAKKNRQYALEANARQFAIQAREFKQSETAEEAQNLLKEWKATTAQWKKDTKEIQEQARGHDEKAKELQKKSGEAHHRSDYFDLGELGVELALVLCSIAVLSKKRGYWYSGIGVGVLGFVVAMCGFAVH